MTTLEMLLRLGTGVGLGALSVDSEAHVRALLVQSLTRTDFRLLSVAGTESSAQGYVEGRTEPAGDERDDAQMHTSTLGLLTVGLIRSRIGRANRSTTL